VLLVEPLASECSVTLFSAYLHQFRQAVCAKPAQPPRVIWDLPASPVENARSAGQCFACLPDLYLVTYGASSTDAFFRIDYGLEPTQVVLRGVANRDENIRGKGTPPP
jgi:hypothetical protein